MIFSAVASHIFGPSSVKFMDKLEIFKFIFVFILSYVDG